MRNDERYRRPQRIGQEWSGPIYLDRLIRPPEPAHEPTDRKRDRDGRIGPVLDVFPDRLFEASGLSPDDGGGLAGRLAGLSVEVLGHTHRLFHCPFDLALDVSGGL